MSLESLQERLSALQETTQHLHALIARLSSSSDTADSPPSEPDPDLPSEISLLLRDQEDDLELLTEEIADLRVPPSSSRDGAADEQPAKSRLADAARRLAGEQQRLRASFRAAQAAAARAREVAARRGRERLLASYAAAVVTPASNNDTADLATSPSPQQHHTQLFPPGSRLLRKGKGGKGGGGSDDGGVVGASTSVTAALRRTHALIAAELARSRFAAETLAESTAALEALGRGYEGLDELLRGSRELLAALLASNKTDTWYLETAFWVLAATLAWLVFRRWVYGPAWWLVWLPLRTVWGLGRRGAVAVVGGEGGRGSEGVVGGGRGGGVDGFDAEGKVAAPTVRTGREERVGGEAGSLVEEVGRMVEEIELQVGGEGGRGLDADGGEDGEEEKEDGSNPMKRMWEEDKEALKEAAQEARIRDEL